LADASELGFALLDEGDLDLLASDFFLVECFALGVLPPLEPELELLLDFDFEPEDFGLEPDEDPREAAPDPAPEPWPVDRVVLCADGFEPPDGLDPPDCLEPPDGLEPGC
jgi:hypothetical protein